MSWPSVPPSGQNHAVPTPMTLPITTSPLPPSPLLSTQIFLTARYPKNYGSVEKTLNGHQHIRMEQCGKWKN
eukprot:15168471-Ditylum_brightwellii.AAC.1